MARNKGRRPPDASRPSADSRQTTGGGERTEPRPGAVNGTAAGTESPGQAADSSAQARGSGSQTGPGGPAIVYGVILILLMFVLPNGVGGLFRRIGQLISSRRYSRSD